MRQLDRAPPKDGNYSAYHAAGNGALRIGVVGLGYYGAFHAQKFATLPDCELVAIVDRDARKAKQMAAEYGVRAFSDHRDLMGLVDAVSVVTPTAAHFSVARDFLEAGVHVLVEKAVTETVAGARELVRLAEQNNIVLQVGHLERFNPAFTALPQHLHSPTYIETHRQTRFQNRGDDVSVVLDLMIHDIDLVHALIPSRIVHIAAKGVSVYSQTPDLVNAVIHFENGAVANLTASRASMEPQRAIHLFQPSAYSCLDMQKQAVTTQEQTADGQLHRNEFHFENTSADKAKNIDVLKIEIASFLDAVNTNKEPVVTGRDGLRALDTAMRISHAIKQSQGSNEPLPVHDTTQASSSFITHDHHPETQKPFFSRTSLVNRTVNLATSIAATVAPHSSAGSTTGETA